MNSNHRSTVKLFFNESIVYCAVFRRTDPPRNYYFVYYPVKMGKKYGFRNLYSLPEILRKSGIR